MFEKRRSLIPTHALRSENEIVAVARRQQYDATGYPIDLTPQQLAPRQIAPQVQADDGYIYPADGSSTEARYPAPRSSRQVYQQQQYYDNRGYQPQYAPQVYAPRPYYQRGLFD